MNRKTLIGLILGVVLAMTATSAPRADDAPLDINRFQPALGGETIVTTDLAAVGPNWQLVPQLFFHYADKPMVYTVGEINAGNAVTNRITGDLGVSLSLYDRFQVGIRLPGTVLQGGESFDDMGSLDRGLVDENGNPLTLPPDEIAARGLEDLRVMVKGVVWQNANWGFGATGSLAVPTGDSDSFLGTRMPSFDVRLIGHYRRGRLTASVNAGALLAATERVLTTTTGFGLTFGTGVEYEVFADRQNTVAVAAELFGLAHSTNARELPTELLVAAKSRRDRWTFFLGGGPGLTRGYGEPNVRVLAGASYSWTPPPKPPEPPEPPELEPKPEPEPGPGPEPDPEPDPEPNKWVDSTLTLPSGVLFEYDRCQIKPASFSELRKVAETLKQNPEWGRIRVEGHASKENEKEEYNLRLSRCRAARVVRFLVYHGVDASRLSYIGFGFTCPRAANDTEDNRRKNRRVEFVRNPEQNPPRCDVPGQLEPLFKHSSEPYLYEKSAPNRGAAPAQPGGATVRPTTPGQPVNPTSDSE